MEEKKLNEETLRKTYIFGGIILVILVSIALICFIVSDKDKKQDTTITKQTTTTTTNIFKGYITTELKDNEELIYDYQKNYKLVYGDTKKKRIAVYHDDLLFNYDITIINGVLTFTEQRYDTSLEAYEVTGKKYEFKIENPITSFLVGNTCDSLTYSIVALDSKFNIYKYTNTPDDENKNIKEILDSFKKVKTISKAKQIGYYNGSNEPFVTCNSYELIYLDNSNNVRYLDGKNSLFFNDAYYRFIGLDFQDQLVFVLKDGKMKFGIGNTKNYLNDGDYNIMYRGSFYQYSEENNQEDLYIIGTDNYLYVIKNMNEESKPILTKVNDTKIKKIGVQKKTNSNDFVIEEAKVVIEFESGTFKLDDIQGYELLTQVAK